MKTFEIEITETLQVIKKVKAENYNDAYEIINEQYKNEEIVLTSEEYVDTIIKPYLYCSKYSLDIENSKFRDYILKNAEIMLSELSTEELITLSFGDIENAIDNFKKS